MFFFPFLFLAGIQLTVTSATTLSSAKSTPPTPVSSLRDTVARRAAGVLSGRLFPLRSWQLGLSQV